MAKKKDPVNFGRFLQEKRVESGLTQLGLSKKLGYSSPQFVSNWERGLCDPPLDAILQMIHIFELNRRQIYDLLLNREAERLKVILKTR